MIGRLFRKWLPWLLIGGLATPLWSAEDSAPVAGADKASVTNRGPVQPGPADGRIGWVTAKLLEQLHYSRQAFDDAVSGKFLDKYLETLDPQHIHFIQEDLDQFEKYRTTLDNLTSTRTGVGDVEPGFVIFNKFVERLSQRVAYAEELLKHEKFTFDADERIAITRKDLPYPKDLDEARKLWKERLRYEFLQEKLGKIESRKKAAKLEEAHGEKEKKETTDPTLAKKKKTDAEDIVDTLAHRYERNLRMFRDWDHEDVLQIYLTTLARVYDPHSDYFSASQLDSFSIGMNLSLFGIGAELTSEDGYCTIRRLLPGGPAAKSKKIKEKDRIVAVAQSNQPPVDVVEMNLNKAVQLIRGPKGSEVRLTIIPAGADSGTRVELSLIRDEIKLEDQEAKAKLIELPAPDSKKLRLGVIDLPSFYATFDPSNSRQKTEPRSTTADVARLITKLKSEGMEGLILDLRHNGGGSLEEAIRLTGLFIKEGPVVQVRDTDGSVQEDADEDPSILYEGPLIVLTSRLSASASEILAGALQDYGRAIIVGDSATHGKGTVQSVNTLKPFMRMGNFQTTNDPGALKVTIKKFYRASGVSTQLKGVVPDIVLPSVFNESKDFGESAMDNPMPWDVIRSASYDPMNMVAPFLPELKKHSLERVAADKDYDYIREDIEHYKKVQADKTVSLNEQQRIKEKEEADARLKAREKERLARAEPDRKVYEISLKQAVLPGLPPPVQKTNALTKATSDSGVSLDTNATASVSHPAAEGGDLEEEERAPSVDALLNEAQRILAEYVTMMPKANVARVNGKVE